MQFPSPVVIEAPGYTAYAKTVLQMAPPTGGTGSSIEWGQGTDDQHAVAVLSLSDEGTYITGPLAGERPGTVILRPLDPYDGVVLSAARVPHPLEVLKAQILHGGDMVATELSAVVNPDNTVSTLLLETGLGTYVRYMGDWQLLSSSSGALDDCEIVTVGPDALPVWDKADAANTSLNISDLPLEVDGELILPADVMPAQSLGDNPAVASGAHIPIIASASDIPAAVKVASAHPETRWYVSRMAKSLGAVDMIPEGW